MATCPNIKPRTIQGCCYLVRKETAGYIGRTYSKAFLYMKTSYFTLFPFMLTFGQVFRTGRPVLKELLKGIIRVQDKRNF